MHLCGGLPALTGVRLVDDNRELAAAVLVADVIEDERELLHGRDDDLLAALDELLEIARVVGVADSRAHLRELLDGVFDLLVEQAAVRDDDHRIDHRLALALQPDELVRKPSDRVALAATGGVLDQTAMTGAAISRVGESFRTTSSWW